MFENRSAIYHNLAGCVVGTAWGAATSLLGSVAVCRLCGVSPELAVVLGNKGISSPFALAGAAALGANEPLTVTCAPPRRPSSPSSQSSPTTHGGTRVSDVILSGVYGGAFGLGVTEALSCGTASNDVACGVSMGTASHGVGTATLIQNGQPRLAALSSVGMILTGVMHTLLCSAPATRRLVHAVAGTALR